VCALAGKERKKETMDENLSKLIAPSTQVQSGARGKEEAIGVWVAYRERRDVRGKQGQYFSGKTYQNGGLITTQKFSKDH